MINGASRLKEKRYSYHSTEERQHRLVLSTAKNRQQILLRICCPQYRRNHLTSLHEVHCVFHGLPRVTTKQMNTDLVKQIKLRSLHQIAGRFSRPCCPIMLQST